MDRLIKSLNEMKEILEKGLAPAKPAGPQAQALPSIQAPPAPSMKPKVPKKMPGIKPASQKDPKKVAQQIKEGSVQQPKTPMLKFNAGGQWTLG